MIEWKKSPPPWGKTNLKKTPFRYSVGSDYIEVRTPLGMDLTLRPIRFDGPPVVYWRPHKHTPAIVIVSFDVERDRGWVTAYEIQLDAPEIDCTLESFFGGEPNCRMGINDTGAHWEGAEAAGAVDAYRKKRINIENLLEDTIGFGRML